MTWLSHSVPLVGADEGHLAQRRGRQHGLVLADLVMTRSSVKGMPFSSNTSLTLL